MLILPTFVFVEVAQKSLFPFSASLNPTTAALAEALKFVVAVVGYSLWERKQRSGIKSEIQTWSFTIPAACLVGRALISLIIGQSASPGLLNLVSLFENPATALLHHFIIRKTTNVRAWSALALITFGLAVFVISAEETIKFSQPLVILLGLISASLSAFRAVYTEGLFQNEEGNFWFIQTWLYGFSFSFSAPLAFFANGIVRETNFGLNATASATLLSIATAISGLLANAIIHKHGNLVKLMGTAVATAIAPFGQFIFSPKHRLRPISVTSACFVLISVYLYKTFIDEELDKKRAVLLPIAESPDLDEKASTPQIPAKRHEFATWALGFLLFCSLISQHPHFGDSRPPHTNAYPPFPIYPTDRPDNAEPYPVQLKDVNSKIAFATLFVGSDAEIGSEDNYFTATRILSYQLLHATETRSTPTIPFLVLVTEKVPEWQRDRLAKDGAVVVAVPKLNSDWAISSVERYEHMFTKLRLYELVDFDRIAFLDSDTILSKPMDGIFDDPAAREQKPLSSDFARSPGANLEPPPTYVFGGNAQNEPRHQFPPSPTGEGNAWYDINNLNGGIFLIKPDIQMLRYLLAILATPNSFDPLYAEQALLNKVFSRDGALPWLQIEQIYTVNFPTQSDLDAGVKSIHAKWWHDEKGLRRWMEQKRSQMLGYFEAIDNSAV